MAMSGAGGLLSPPAPVPLEFGFQPFQFKPLFLGGLGGFCLEPLLGDYQCVDNAVFQSLQC